MLRLPTYVIAIVVVLVSTINAQAGSDACNNGIYLPGVDPSWRNVPPRFEIFTELISDKEVAEVSQAFSPVRDAVAFSARARSVQFYWNFDTNEQFEVINVVNNQQVVPTCLRQVIKPESETSVIQTGSNILKPSVLLGYGQRNQNNTLWGLRYFGQGSLRGIPTNIFKSCFRAQDIQANVAATFHVSDVTKFQAYLPANDSIILQIDVTVYGPSGNPESYSYNVFRYSPNPSRREERQALETPTGVYCLNRTATIPVPTNIPDRVSANAEVLVPFLGAAITSSHSLYDTEFQFTRFDAYYPNVQSGESWLHFTDLHDFGTGLSYRYNHSNNQCTYRNISRMTNDVVHVADDDSDLLQMGDPQHLFLMDNIDFQYTGEKRCRDRVLCHVWIGERVSRRNSSISEHREWYWASSINGEELKPWIPMKLILKRFVSGAPVMSFEINLFDYRRNPFTIFEVDYTLAECYRSLGPAEKFNLAVLAFTIKNDKKYPVFQNLNYLRLHIWETLTFSMFVRPIRISHLIVDQNGDDIIVTFTLLDAAPVTGPVEDPIQESSLDTLIERLTKIIDAGGLAFRARTANKQVVLRAKALSLNIIRQTTVNKNKSSGPRITGLWIGLIFAGIFVGGIVAFFAFGKLAKR